MQMATKTNSHGKERSAKYQKAMLPTGVAPENRALTPQAKGEASREIAGVRGSDAAYLLLITRLPLRPIRSDAQLDAAAALIDELTDRDDLSPAESDYLDVLGDLVEKYEDVHIKMPYVSDAAMLQHLIEEKGVRQAEVVRGTGISKTVLSLVLSGKRDLTRAHIHSLANFFAVDPAIFLGPTK